MVKKLFRQTVCAITRERSEPKENPGIDRNLVHENEQKTHQKHYLQKKNPGIVA